MVNNDTIERIFKLVLFIKTLPHDLTNEEIRQVADEVQSWLNSTYIKDESEDE